MKKSIIYCAIALFAAASCGKEAPAPAQRWSEERANAWYAEQEWPVGFNYVAATAINQFEMWQAESFDPKTIDYEMSKAEELGVLPNLMKIQKYSHPYYIERIFFCLVALFL